MGGMGATDSLLELCGIEPSSRVLDVGSGPGATGCLISDRYGARVDGIDISKVMVAKSQDRARRLGVGDRVTFRVADVFDLPFDDETFDVALVESVLTLLPRDKSQAIAEMVRVLKTGGRLDANEAILDPKAPPEVLAAAAEHPAVHGYFTAESLRALFEGAGLEVLHQSQAKSVEAPGAIIQLGCRGLLSFDFRAYPKILLQLLRDKCFRESARIDDMLTKQSKEYMGYVLIVGEKSV